MFKKVVDNTSYLIFYFERNPLLIIEKQLKNNIIQKTFINKKKTKLLKSKRENERIAVILEAIRVLFYSRSHILPPPPSIV